MKLKVSVDLKQVNDLDKRGEAEAKKLAKDAHLYFILQTPMDKGFARRHTRLVNNKIEANYAYAERLDEGYSKQAPKGMVEPTEKYIDKVLIPNAVRRLNRGK
jgi:hypothetical protein